MRSKHVLHTLEGFPIYSSAFLSPSKLLLGGGGGQARSGVKNKIRLYDIVSEELKLVDEYELEVGADTPMSIGVDGTNESFVCGANSSADYMAKGENMHCRLFTAKDDKIKHVKSVKAMKSVNGDAYQRVTVFSPSNDLLAVGISDNEVHLLHYPTMTRAAPVIEISAGDLFDVTLSTTRVAIASSTNIYIYNLHEEKAPSENILKAKNARSSKGKKKEEQLESLEMASTIVRPKLPSQGSATSTFRALRFHPSDWSQFFAVLNTTQTGGRRQRRSYVVKYEWYPKLKNWQVVKTKKIGDGSITTFDVSADGKFLGYGASDCSIGVLDAVHLSPLLKILGAHEFPSTTLKFNTDRSLLVSASADNSVRVVAIPAKFEDQGSTTRILYIAILVILIALLIQMYPREGPFALKKSQ